MFLLCLTGKARKESSLNEDQKLQKITEPPTALEYFCYVFNFLSLLAGPSCTIHEFQAFMDGSNLRPMENPNAFARVSLGCVVISYRHRQAFLMYLSLFSCTAWKYKWLVVNLHVVAYLLPPPPSLHPSQAKEHSKEPSSTVRIQLTPSLTPPPCVSFVCWASI